MAANFGYEIIAAGQISLEDKINGTLVTCPGAGAGQSITVYLTGWTSGEKVKCCLYDASGDKVTDGETEERTTGGATDWHIFNFISPPTLSAANYWIVAFGDSLTNMHYAYETAPGYTMKYQGARVYELGFPASIAGLGTDYADSAFSIFCTYEEAGPSYVPNVIMVQYSSIAKKNKIYRRLRNLWLPQLKKLWLPTPSIGVPKRILV